MLKTWIIYDERGYLDTDAACMMSALSSEDFTLEDAIRERDKDWPGCPIYEYDVEPNDHNDGILINKKLIN